MLDRGRVRTLAVSDFVIFPVIIRGCGQRRSGGRGRGINRGAGHRPGRGSEPRWCLDGVQYLASAGLRVLIEAKDPATEKGRDLRLVCHSPNANRVLDGSGLRDQFNFADTVPMTLSR